MTSFYELCSEYRAKCLSKSIRIYLILSSYKFYKEIEVVLKYY